MRRHGLSEVGEGVPSSSVMSLLEEVAAFFAEAEMEAYLVGGFVRDRLLGRSSWDIDLAVAGDAMALGRRLAHRLRGSFVPLNEPHQMARVVVRRDDELWHLDMAPFQGTIEEDMGRRDFTIDALALPLSGAFDASAVIDPFGGRADLASRLVRALNGGVFEVDPARLLRAVRLGAELDFLLEAATAGLVRANAPRLLQVAAERVSDDLSRLLTTPRAAVALRRMDGLGLLTVLIPELEPTRATDQPKEHYWNVLDHSLATVAALEAMLCPEAVPPGWLGDGVLEWLPRSEALGAYFDEVIGGGRRRRETMKLAALLHDVAKPACKTTEPGGRIRFLGHAEAGAAVAGAILRRLRFSRAEVSLVERMVKHHLRPGQLPREGAPTRRAMYRYFRDTAGAGVDTIFLNLADHLATRGPRLDEDEWRRHIGTARCLLEWHHAEKSRVAPPKLIDGHDIMKEFDLGPGPEVGRLLALAREAQAAGEVDSREEALAFLRRHL